MKKIRALIVIQGVNPDGSPRTYAAGTEFSIEGDEAERLVSRGFAEFVEPKK